MADDPNIPPADASPIQELSMEMLLRVAFWLKTPDLCNVRLTCRAFKNFLQNSFIEEFIAKKQFMISPSSLQALVDLSKSPFGPHLRRLQLSTDVVSEHPIWTQQSTGRIEGKRLAQAQEMCLRDGSHRRLLAEAFKNLHDLSPGGLREDFEIVVRDFNSRRRTRDAGPGAHSYAEWKSHGAATAENLGLRVWKCRDHSHDSHAGFPTTMTHIFRYVLMALGDAGVSPAGIEAMARNGDFLSNDAFVVNPWEPSMVGVLQGFKKLHLTLKKKHPWGSESTFDPDSATLLEYTEHVLNDLPEFLSHCPNLTELRINQDENFTKTSETFLAWLSKPVVEVTPKSWPDPIAMANLQSLSIGMTITRPSTILAIMTKLAPTLRSLELWKVTLTMPFDFEHSRNIPDAGAWKLFLSKMTQVKGLQLNHILLGNISESFYPAEPSLEVSSRAVRATIKRRMNFDGHYKTEYRGPDWLNAIPEMINGLVPQLDLDAYKDMLRVHEIHSDHDEDVSEADDVSSEGSDDAENEANDADAVMVSQ